MESRMPWKGHVRFGGRPAETHPDPWAGRCWSTLHDIKSHKHHPPDRDRSEYPPGQPSGVEDEVWFHELDEPEVCQR